MCRCVVEIVGDGGFVCKAVEWKVGLMLAMKAKDHGCCCGGGGSKSTEVRFEIRNDNTTCLPLFLGF